jgi:diguanylate cyclase (GGDEF)-like protein
VRSSTAASWANEPGTRPGAKTNSNKPPVCVVATRIVQEAVNANASAAELAKLAQSDAGFAMRVLSVVNSAAFQRGHKVANVQQACALLGVRGLRNVALGLIVGDMVPLNDDGAELLSVSLRRGVAARVICEALGRKDMDEAFTAGILLEVALLAQARENLSTAAQIARMPAAHRRVVERAFSVADHAEAGAALAREMGLHETTVEAILHHHDPAPPAAPLAQLAWAAERVAAVWEGGDVARLRAAARETLLQLGLKQDTADGVLRRIPELVTQTASAFQRSVGDQIDLDQLQADAHAQLVELNQGYEQVVRRLEELLREKDALAAELKKANAELETLAATDALTGLPNKRSLMNALNRDLALADRTKTSLALVVADVDFFKKVNDTYGHLTGDLVLAKMGQILPKCVRASDMAARYGGEEFVAVLVGTHTEGARIVAERMRTSVQQATVAGPKGPLSVTASFGVAAITGPGCRASATDLIARADAALYEAKRAGRNRVVVAA